MRRVLVIVAMLIGMSMNAQTPKEITNAGLKELGIENVFVFIKPLSKNKIEAARLKGAKLMGHMKGANGQYVMELDMELKIHDMVETIAHELIHLKQLETKVLLVRNAQVIYKRTYYRNANVIPYSSRVWEVDAEVEGTLLAYKLRQVL